MKNFKYKYFIFLLFLGVFQNFKAEKIWTEKSILSKSDKSAKLDIIENGIDLKLETSVTNQCNYNGINATGNTNQYTITIKNNLPFPVTTSENTKVEVKFNVKNGALITDSKLLAFTSTGDNAKWDTPIETYIPLSNSNDYTFELKTGQTIPANGSITLVFSKNWNLVDLVFGTERLGENDVNSLDIKLNVLNSSNQNIDDNTLDNTAFISVFRTSNINAQSITKTVGQGEVITVGEVANLGDHTNGFKFYYNNAEISSSYLVPTSTRTPFVFQYESACNSAKATVTAQVGFDSPGRITLDQNINLTQRTLIENIKLCPGSSIKINTMELATYFYSWEFSKDGGITWITSSEMGIEESDTAYNLELESLSESLKVRRISKRILDGNTAYSNEVTIIVQDDIKFNFPNNINSFAIRKGDVFTLPTITTNLNTTITIKNDQGQIVSSSIPFNNAGEYYFTVNAKTTSANNQLENCEASTTFKVVVYDLEDCGVNYKKVFATHYRTWTSGIGWTDDADRAVNGNRANSAKINSAVNVAGLGTVGIDLYFTKPDGVTLYTPNELKGKKVTLKLGEQYSGLKIAGGLSVVGRVTTASSNNIGLVNGIPAGTENYNSGFSTAVKGGLLDALKGDNVFQFSFVPGDINGVPVPYNGVRIQLGSLLGVADLANVFYAYIEEEVATDVSQDIIRVDPPQSLNYPTSQNDINGTYITGIDNEDFLLNPFVDDVSWGNRTEVVNVASSLSSVVFPYYAVDNDVNSYALFNSIVGVLNQQFLKTHLRKPARPGDQVQITISYPEISVVNLSLLQLGNFRIVFYLGDTEVGNIPLEEFRILDLGLFRLKFGEVQRTILSKQINVPFDSFEIRQFNTVTVNLGEGLRVHDVRVGPMMLFEGQEDPTATTIICASELLGIQDPSICNSYDVALVEILEFGDTFVDKDGNPILDKDGSPVKSIKTIGNVITNLTPVNISGNSLVSYYKFDQLYKEYEKEGILLIRVQAKRDGVNYGDPEYLKIKLRNCNDAIVNPVIKINAGK